MKPDAIHWAVISRQVSASASVSLVTDTSATDARSHSPGATFLTIAGRFHG
jgi:hypothetical protein